VNATDTTDTTDARNPTDPMNAMNPMIVVSESRAAGVALLQDQEAGEWIVLVRGAEFLRTRVESLARLTYDEQREAGDPARERRARERAHYEIQAVRSDSFARRADLSRRKGGRGGRGGV
jgi:hypothetical protein